MKRKSKKNTRKIGEDYCKEVKELLEKMGHVTDGPFYKVQFVKGRMRKVHNDIFRCFDLISINPTGNIFLHQITTLNMKSNKEKKIRTLGVSGILWCYDSEDREDNFRVFLVTVGGTEEVKSLRSEKN